MARPTGGDEAQVFGSIASTDAFVVIQMPSRHVLWHPLLDQGAVMKTQSDSPAHSRPWTVFTAVLVLCWLMVGALDFLLRAFLDTRTDLPLLALAGVRHWGAHAVLTPFVVWALTRVPFGRGRLGRATGWSLLILLAYVVVLLGYTFSLPGAFMRPDDTIDAAWFLRRDPNLYYTVFGVILVFLVSAGAINGWGFYLRYRERADAAAALELERATLRALLSESRLDLLQARLRPHFLFNALHAITGLVDEDPPKAKDTIRRLSNLLRRALDDTDTPKVTLERELNWLRDYIEIARVRFEDRLSVHIDVAPSLGQALVPNVLLQPIVENAVRHGIAKLTGPGLITIAGRREGDQLTIDVCDNGPGAPDVACLERRGGEGLSNTRMRLATLYGDRATLSIAAPPTGGFSVSIKIPFEELPGSALGSSTP
jgi:two-component system LytT family sensor kinase